MKHLTFLFLFICSVAFGQSKTCVNFDKFFDVQSETYKKLDVQICSLKDGKEFTIRGELFKTTDVDILNDMPVYTIEDKHKNEYFLGFHENPRGISLFSLKSRDLLMFYLD